MESEKASEWFTRSEVLRILGISENRLRAWERNGLAETREGYSFADLVSLTTLQSLSENDIAPKCIREALHQLQSRLTNVLDPLHELKIVPQGRRIAVEMPGERMEALTGQLLFDFDAEDARPVATIESGSQQTPSGESGEFWFQYALDLESSGSPPEEIDRVYRKVLERDEHAAGAWVNIGTLRYRQGHLESAERAYRRALESYPAYALAHFNLGNVCEETNRLDEAAEHYEAALRHRPDYADAHYNLALLEERRQRYVTALQHWQAYLNLDPASPWSRVAHRKRKQLLQSSGSEDHTGGSAIRRPLKGARE